MKYLDLTPGELYGVKKQQGEVGIEVELEGRNLHQGALREYWTGHEDGSLRAVDGHPPQEYTLKRPLARTDTRKALDYLKNRLDLDKSEVSEGAQRTSVHIHLNVQDMTIRQVLTLLTVYYVVEDLLVEYAGGKLRRGNLFCLRGKDAEFVIAKLRQVVETGSYNLLADPERLKYHACNVSAVTQYGSLEFRAHRGTSDPETIQRWIDLLLSLKDASLKFTDPQVVIQRFSQEGASTFLRTVFGDLRHNLMFDNYQNRLWEGLRLAQDVAYAVPSWETKKEDTTTRKLRGDLSDYLVNIQYPDNVLLDELLQEDEEDTPQPGPSNSGGVLYAEVPFPDHPPPSPPQSTSPTSQFLNTLVQTNHLNLGLTTTFQDGQWFFSNGLGNNGGQTGPG